MFFRLYTTIYNCFVKGCNELMSVGKSLNDTATKVGTIVKVTCQTGYRLDGASVVTCVEDGQWSDETSCVYIGKSVSFYYCFS